MSTALRLGLYRFFFYSSGRMKPRHAQVERYASRAKFRLDPVRPEDGGGVRDVEHDRTAALVETTAKGS